MGGIDEWAIEKALEFGVKNSWNQIQKERTYRRDADARTAETFKLMMELPYIFFDFNDWHGEYFGTTVFTGYGSKVLRISAGRSSSNCKVLECPTQNVHHAREVRKIYELICENTPEEAHDTTRFRFEKGVYKGTGKESDSCVVM